MLTMFFIISFTLMIYCLINECQSVKLYKWQKKPEEHLQDLLNYILEEMTQKSKCMVFIIDAYYRKFITVNWKKLSVIPYYSIYVRQSEEFMPPRRKIEDMLSNSKNDGCDAYVILITNGLQVSQLLEYAERNRKINTQGNFIFIRDPLLFDLEMKYIWNRLTNVMFIHRFTVSTSRFNKIITKEYFNLETVNYPIRTKNFVETRYVDTWYKGRMLHKNINYHLLNKTLNLNKKTLNVAIFEHVPAVTRYSRQFYKNHRGYSDKAIGVEFEILRILMDKMNFKSNFYSPKNIKIDKWGRKIDNGSYNGLLGEAERGNAEFLLGDLHYTSRHFQLLELSYPYNSECLTFLTPESLTDNSWKLLIVPFKLYAWLAVILILLLGACAFHFFAEFYQKHILPYVGHDDNNKVIISNEKSLVLRNENNIGHVHVKNMNKIWDEHLEGLTLFTNVQNSMLYTYSMLLQVSLPRLPRPWALRVFIGWWLLYSILVTVAYRASMTATLANPVARITIDTLTQLARSKIPVGGWGEDTNDLFLFSLDEDLNEIGTRFQLTLEENSSVARVANGTFGYYENVQTLQEARAKRQLLEQMQKKMASHDKKVIDDRNLHIMSECVIYMPISIGMDRNSPLKPQVDDIVRRLVETGFVRKWLNDVTEWSKIVELKDESPSAKAIVDLHKLHGALVALGIGYFLGLIALMGEFIHWRYFVMKDPAFDKYQMDLFYSIPRSIFVKRFK